MAELPWQGQRNLPDLLATGVLSEESANDVSNCNAFRLTATRQEKNDHVGVTSIVSMFSMFRVLSSCPHS